MVKEKIETILETEPILLDFKGIINFTDDKLYEFCINNKGLKVERSSKAEIIIMPPTGSEGASYEAIVIHRLQDWNLKVKNGKVFSSSGGFILPNKSMKSPDASFITKDHWKLLKKNDIIKFAHICPDFIIEIRSRTDKLQILKDKMTEWMENGCRLAWLIDPLEEKAYIYRPNKEIEEVSSFKVKLSGENILPDFKLDLSELREEV